MLAGLKSAICRMHAGRLGVSEGERRLMRSGEGERHVGYVRNECEKCLRAALRAFAASGMTQQVGVEHLSHGFTGTKGCRVLGGGVFAVHHLLHG